MPQTDSEDAADRRDPNLNVGPGKRIHEASVVSREHDEGVCNTTLQSKASLEYACHPPRISIDSSVVLACASKMKNRDITAMVQRSENRANALPPQANSPFPKGMLDRGYKEVSTHSSIRCSISASLTRSCASRLSPRTTSRGYYITEKRSLASATCTIYSARTTRKDQGKLILAGEMSTLGTQRWCRPE